ncbi:MAG: hypothetical protein KAJ45_02235 [Desulfobulbaceae bacterium]|nr:hypothetical protein [Desulfobulbaceae bacterium]
MRCPKCGYISFDHLISCSNCGKNLTETSGELKGTSVTSHTSFFLDSVFETKTESAEPEKGSAGETDADEAIELDIPAEEQATDEAEELEFEPAPEIVFGEDETNLSDQEVDEMPTVSLDQFEDTSKSDKDASEEGLVFSLDESQPEIEEPGDEAITAPAATEEEPLPALDEIEMPEPVSLEDAATSASVEPLPMDTPAAEVEPLPESDEEPVTDMERDLDVMSLVTDETGLDMGAFNGEPAGEMESKKFEADGDDELADLSDILNDVDENSDETDTIDLDSISSEKTAESGPEPGLADLPEEGALELDLSLEGLSLEDGDEKPAGGSDSDSAGESVPPPVPDISELDLTLESEDDE